MSLLKTSALFGTLTLLSQVSAHGIVTGVVADGVSFQGYDPSFQYQQNPPKVAGWTAPLTQDRGFVGPDGYSSSDIICHKGATPGQDYIKVSAGGTIELQWTEWPESHHGPMLDYLAPCGDDCTTVDKTSLEWTKIDEAGLNSWDSQPGDWASDDMIRAGNKWTLTIPSSIAAGKYVLRHETIALHSANQQGGAQNYPQCMNIEVSGSGTDGLTSGGTLGTDLYTASDAGIFVNIYQKLTSYEIPGSALYSGSGSTPQPSASASTPADVSITATPTTGIAIPTGEPPSSPTPLYPIPGNSTATNTRSTPASTTRGPIKPSHTWADWGNTSPNTPPTATPEIPADATTDIPSSAPTSYPQPGSGSGEEEEEEEEEETPAPGTGSGGSPPSGEYPEEEEEEEPETPAPATTTPPTSFSSTVTGRIGKPTKFVCYLEE